jgi:DNA polymerase III epsilon subunit-like protein
MAAVAQQGKDWRDGTFVVIDTETTGKDTDKDVPVEVSLVCIHQKKEIAKTSVLRRGFGSATVSDEARQIHGITEEELDAAEDADVADNLINTWSQDIVIDGTTIVQWGNDFDHKMMRSVRGWDSATPFDAASWVDLCSIVRFLEKGLSASYRLEDVAARYDIPLYRAHRALPDAEATGQILIHVLPKIPSKTRDEFLSFAKEASVWAEQDRLRAQQERKEQPKKNAGVKRSSPEPAAAAVARPQKTTKRVFEIDLNGPKCLKCQGPSTIAECGSGKNKGKEAWFCHRKRNGLPGTTEACGFIKIVS